MRVAASLLDGRESDLRPPLGLSAGKPIKTEEDRSRPLWFYFVGAALLIAVSEWLLFHRGVIE